MSVTVGLRYDVPTSEEKWQKKAVKHAKLVGQTATGSYPILIRSLLRASI